MFQRGVRYGQGYCGSGSSQKLCVSGVSITVRRHCAKFALRDPSGAGGSVLNLPSLGHSCSDGARTVGACGTAAPPHPRRAAASSSCHCLLPGGLLPLPLPGDEGLVVLLQLQHLHPDATLHMEGAWMDHALGTTGTRLSSPAKSSGNWVTSCEAGQPTSLPHWETGGGIVVGFCFFFLIPILA